LKIRRHSSDYNFIGDTETGVTFRWGKTFEENPAYAPWPELADISISNHCTKGCDFCYRDSTANQSFITLKDYERILRELIHPKWGSVFQVALGGGEPFEHPHLREIIDLTVTHKIVPNLTTNGLHINRDWIDTLREKVGAIAVSTDNVNEIDYDKIALLTNCGVRTNIHYLLNKCNIAQASQILNGSFDERLSGLNSIIFLTHKPSGRAKAKNTLQYNDDLRAFIQLIDNRKTSFRIGFDACFVPVLLHLTQTNTDYVDSCECGFFSVYIDERMNVKPCSFAKDGISEFNLHEITLREIWEEKYQEYRCVMKNDCKRDCKNKRHCRGACIYYHEINYCHSRNREEAGNA
jgi:MoaA/NifB/PqqE/SkfB family radical SAM enzyme